MIQILRRLFGDSTSTANSTDSKSVCLQGLTLYYTHTCPFCAKVLRVLVEQGLGVGKKNIATNSTARDELIQGGGKPTVPCLKIERNGEDRWLYESGDIIAYLEQVAR